VICVAGGWAGGGIESEEALHTMAAMHAMNIESALLGKKAAA
jgi:hypothetical protein